MRPTRLLQALLAPALFVAGCVSPLVNHTPYQNPYFPKDQFEQLFASWKSGRAVTWEVHYRGTQIAQQELVILSSGQGSLGARLTGVDNQARSFTVAKAELTKLVDALTGSGVFALYDGHYGAWAQAGGVGGPELRVLIGGMEKHVSKDASLSSSISWEAGAIEKASNAALEIGLKYLK